MDISKVVKYASIGVATIGAGVGIYIFAKKRKEKKEAEKAAAEEEIRKVTSYTEGADRYNTYTVITDETQVQEFIDKNFNSEPIDRDIRAIGIDLANPVPTPVNVENEEYIPEEDPNDPEMVIPPENNYDFPSDEPFEIDYQTFDQTRTDFYKVDVTYYDGDGEFVGDINGKEEIIDFPDDSFGKHVLDFFRDEGGIRRKRKVWIRNPGERTDYEITYNTDSYNYETYEDIPGGID